MVRAVDKADANMLTLSSTL